MGTINALEFGTISAIVSSCMMTVNCQRYSYVRKALDMDLLIKNAEKHMYSEKGLYYKKKGIIREETARTNVRGDRGLQGQQSDNG